MISQLWRFLQGNKGVVRLATEDWPSIMFEFHIHELPDFLILKIFRFLFIREKLLLRRVSKKWYQLLSDFSIWKDIKLNEDMLFAHRIDRVNFRKWIDQFGSTLQSLDTSYADWIKDDDVIYAVRACTNLRCLILKACSKVTDTAINEVARKCVKLRKINIFLTKVTSAGFEEITVRCQQIETVKLGCQGNTNKMLQSLCENNNRLTNISIEDVIPDNSSEPSVNDLLIKRMALKFSLLRRINLTWCCYITNASLVEVATHCTNLQNLKLRECPQLTDEGLKSVFQKCVNLRHLCLERLYGVTDDISTVINDNLGKLLTLKIFDTKMTDKGLGLLADQCTELRKLSFGEYNFHPKFVEGSCLRNVARNCKKLKRLHVYSERITNEELQAIGETLRELTHLSIGDCQQCSGNAVVEMAQHCTQLRQLTIKNCNGVDELQASAIRSSLKYLRNFQLPGNTRVMPFGSWLGNALGFPFS